MGPYLVAAMPFVATAAVAACLPSSSPTRPTSSNLREIDFTSNDKRMPNLPADFLSFLLYGFVLHFYILLRHFEDHVAEFPHPCFPHACPSALSRAHALIHLHFQTFILS